MKTILRSLLLAATLIATNAHATARLELDRPPASATSMSSTQQTADSLFSDLLEQADDFEKLAKDKPENFKPANPTPAELKASIKKLQTALKNKTALTDDDVKKIADIETKLTQWQFWDRGPYVDEATIKATTSAFGTTRDRVLQSIQSLAGRTCRWGYIAALFTNGWICN